MVRHWVPMKLPLPANNWAGTMPRLKYPKIITLSGMALQKVRRNKMTGTNSLLPTSLSTQI